MYRRFLNNNDYFGIITKDALYQLTRGNDEKIVQAEESAEISIIEHLTENYEIERELSKGKFIADYDRRISYPVGAHIYFDDKICEVTRSISGFKAPADIEYWEEHNDVDVDISTLKNYTQFGTYYTGDLVVYNGIIYICLAENGYKFGDIRIPLVRGWIEVTVSDWLPINYNLWEVVRYDNGYYTLILEEDFDNNIHPEESANWGAIADYTPEYNSYELSGHEYVVFNQKVFHPEIDVNSDVPAMGTNLVLNDPRNYNLKKHLIRLSLYELTKLIAPNNVSVVRMRDYEDSMKWLNDASKLRINPQIPRKIAEDNKPVTDWQMATFQTDYDPYKNPWLT